MKVEGFRKVFFQKVCLKRLGTKKLIAKKGYLTLKSHVPQT